MGKGARCVCKLALILEDETMRLLNQRYLQRCGFQVLALREPDLPHGEVDCVLLDADLPGARQGGLCARLRAASHAPVILLGERRNFARCGADAGLPKPYSLRELEACVRACIGRSHGAPEALLRFGRLRLDLAAGQASFADEPLELSPLEFSALAFLAGHPGETFSCRQIDECIRRESITGSSHSMQLVLARVRQKMERLCPGRSLIEVIPRRGYRFVPPDEKQLE